MMYLKSHLVANIKRTKIKTIFGLHQTINIQNILLENWWGSIMLWNALFLKY